MSKATSEIPILSQGTTYYACQVNENWQGIASSTETAKEFRDPSWKTEGPWELLRHYNIATVLTDSPAPENLGFLSEEHWTWWTKAMGNKLVMLKEQKKS
jgi:hypothetical protein